MPDSFESSMNQPSRSADAIPAIPPSSSEVDIRTLESDLELMGKSGGLPNQNMQFGAAQSIGNRPASPIIENTASTAAPLEMPRARMSGKQMLMIALIVIVVAFLLFAAGFYLYPLFAGE